MKKLIYLITITLVITGCAAPNCYYQVKTVGLLGMSGRVMTIPPGSSFAVMSSKGARCPLFNNEIKYKIERLLSQRDYFIHASESADYYLFFNYSIAEACSGDTRKISVKVINAEDFRSDEGAGALWSGYAVSQGQFLNPAGALDYQLVSLFEYFGKNTYTRKKVDIDVDDRRVIELQSQSIPLP
jgi:hypothetical protein